MAVGTTLRSSPSVAAIAMAIVVAFAVALLPAPASAVEAPVAPTAAEDECSVRHAVVSDIDETLTVSDREFLEQLFDPSHDPAERPAASEMMRAYAEKGYWVVYVTARPEQLRVSSGSARGLTSNWLAGHAFPVQPDNAYLYLAPDLLSALLPRYYKAAAIEGLQSQGFVFDYAYGNAETDFQAFSDAGIPGDQTFSIGELAGYGGTVAITEEGYETHLATHMPAVQPTCDAPFVCPVIPYDGVLQAILASILPIEQHGRRLACGF